MFSAAHPLQFVGGSIKLVNEDFNRDIFIFNNSLFFRMKEKCQDYFNHQQFQVFMLYILLYFICFLKLKIKLYQEEVANTLFILNVSIKLNDFWSDEHLNRVE